MGGEKENPNKNRSIINWKKSKKVPFQKDKTFRHNRPGGFGERRVAWRLKDGRFPKGPQN